MTENVFERLINDDLFDQLNNMVRWNGLNRNKDETVAHHSYIVTFFARVMAEEVFEPDNFKSKLAMVNYAIFHDFDEVFTGDVNHNVKYNEINGESIRVALNDFVESRVHMNFPDDTNFDSLFRNSILEEEYLIKKLVKVCDWLSMGFYLKKEIALGNLGLTRKYDYCLSSMKKHTQSCLDELPFKANGVTINLNILEQILKINWKYDGIDD